ncbi:MAG: hypothetical protein EOP83_03180 [Verrucomicrobiaceae bacterium]|nr:MAG: hypothetical protein EOP83_03180 [Verrucomicrobiaceae bacterium]
MIWAILVLLLAMVVGGIPYLIVIVKTCRAKDWRKLKRVIAYPAVGAVVLLGVGRFSDYMVYRRNMERVFDTSVTMTRPIFKYNSERGFNGDGYSFAVYPLPDSIRHRFEEADRRPFKGAPERPSYRDHWKTYPWHEGPFDPAWKEHLDFALSRLDSDKEPRLEPYFSSLRSALGRKQTWYAFFYHDPGDHPGNIDFFVVDLESGHLYQINHNT